MPASPLSPGQIPENFALKKDSRKLQHVEPTTVIDLAEVHREGRAIVRAIAERERAKVIAAKAGITPRQAYNYREHEHDPGWLAFMALAAAYPELRAAVARWLRLDFDSQQSAEEALQQIARLAQRLPEPGDQA